MLKELLHLKQKTSNSSKKFIPVITIFCCLVSIILFVGINFEETRDSYTIYKKWGSPSLTNLFKGSYWGLITTNFLHVDWWHIIPNLYWLLIFGIKIEFETNKTFYALLLLSSSVVSSLTQLSFGDSMGMGLSGIVYSLFGFIWIGSKTTDVYKNYLTKNIVNLFLIWLVLCILLTQKKILIVGNAAHFGGLLWGMLLAYIVRVKMYKQWIIQITLIAVLASSIFWNPFSTSWLTYQAYVLYENKKFDEAKIIYKKILSIDSNNESATLNLKTLEIYELQKKAYELHKNKRYTEAKKIYYDILNLDKDNQWAIVNLAGLPNQ